MIGWIGWILCKLGRHKWRHWIWGYHPGKSWWYAGGMASSWVCERPGCGKRIDIWPKPKPPEHINCRCALIPMKEEEK